MFSFDTSDLEMQAFLEGLEDWPSDRKVSAFIDTMRLNSADLIAFRNDPETREFVARHEDAIWAIWANIAQVVSSIRACNDADAAKDEIAKRHHLALVKASHG